MEVLSHLMMLWAQANPILDDVPTVGHQRPVGDMMCIQLTRPATHTTPISISGEDCLPKARPDFLLALAHDISPIHSLRGIIDGLPTTLGTRGLGRLNALSV